MINEIPKIEYEGPKNPFDILQLSQNSEDLEEAIGFNPLQHYSYSAPVELVDEEEDEDYSSSYSEVSVQTNDIDPSMIITDLKNIRPVIAARVKHQGGQLSRTCQGYPGFIVLPLNAIGMLRFPDKRHRNNSKVFIYIPDSPRAIENTKVSHPDITNLVNILNP